MWRGCNYKPVTPKRHIFNKKSVDFVVSLAIDARGFWGNLYWYIQTIGNSAEKVIAQAV
jgi:hypothetical protein